MQLHEANKRLKNPLTETQWESIDCLYNLLNMDKDDFCKIVDTVGLEVLAKQRQRYTDLFQGARREQKRLHSLDVMKKVVFHLDDGRDMEMEPVTSQVLLTPGVEFGSWLTHFDIQFHQEDREYTLLEPYISEGEELWRRSKRKIVVESMRYVEVSEPITTDMAEFII